nr:MAG TPA: hypothetical protein [Caudoviricetes sp.]
MWEIIGRFVGDNGLINVVLWYQARKCKNNTHTMAE